MKQAPLVRRGAPATVDNDRDPIPCGIRGRVAERIEQIWIEIGHGRNVIIECRQAGRDGAIRVANRLPMDAADERRADDDKGSEDGRSDTTSCDWCWLAVGHAGSLDSVVSSARMRFSIYGRYVRVPSIEGVCVC